MGGRHLGRLNERRKKNSTATEDAKTSSNLYYLLNRKLSTRVEKDPVNPKVIISSRKRDDTGANALSCRWR
jgi:hypothetical protein